MNTRPSMSIPIENSGMNQTKAWEHVRDVVGRSGTSFLWGMKVLPKARRRAMYAIYTFCREVDDIADEPGEIREKKRALADWRAEIDLLYDGQPSRLTTLALLEPVQCYDLPKQEFLYLIDGMESDTAPTVQINNVEELMVYCRKVAVSVAMLSIHTFGTPEHPAPQLARAVGNALQLTNILRDLRVDAEIQRLYLPHELLSKHGIVFKTPQEVLIHPNLTVVCNEIAEIAHRNYAEADRLIKVIGRKKMRPFVIMMAVYRENLALMEKRGWQNHDHEIQLSTARKILLALKSGYC